MQSWPSTAVPSLPGKPDVLRLHDSAAASLVTVDPDRTAKLYVCGITPYDATHLGHAATYLAFDLLVRSWLDRGLTVEYVQNVTDIDDPLLERAARDGEDWVVVAERETALFRQDMTALRVLPPTHYVGAVEAMQEIGEVVQRLVDAGAAYLVPSEDAAPDVYFRTSCPPHFGEVAGLSREVMTALSAQRGGDPDRPGKHDPLDPLLWRAARKGEPAWESPVGRGRPGWHVECTAIAMNRLGERLDVQGGGSDLVFPHHEMSASHAEVLSGRWPYATAHVHAGMIGLDGEKMSKSRGNLVFVSRLRSGGTDMGALRLALLSSHYRTDRTWSDSVLHEGERRLLRWREGVRRPAGPAGGPVLDAVRAALANDLDAPSALATVDAWCAQPGQDEGSPSLVARLVDALLGVDTTA